MADRYSSGSGMESDSSQSSLEMDLDLLGCRRQLSPPPELMAAIDPRTLQVERHELAQLNSPEVIAISSDDEDEDHPDSSAPAAGPSNPASNPQLMALMPFSGVGNSASVNAMGNGSATPTLNSINNSVGSLAASGDEIGDEIYRSAIHIVLNQVINPSTSGDENGTTLQSGYGRRDRGATLVASAAVNIARTRAGKQDQPGIGSRQEVRHFRVVSRPRSNVFRISKDGICLQNVEHLMSSSSSDESGSETGSESGDDSGSDADEETESDTEVDEPDESPWYANRRAFRTNTNAPLLSGLFASTGPAIAGETDTTGAHSSAAAMRNVQQSANPSSLLGCIQQACSGNGSAPGVSQRPQQRRLDPVIWQRANEQQRLALEADKEKERQERLAIQVEIELRIPRTPQWDEIEVETTEGTKLKANFPEIAAIEAGSKSPQKPPRPLFKISQGHDPYLLQQAIKHHEESMKAAESLKKFQTTSVLHARWLPDRHKAQVTLRRGKMLETMGSPGNPAMLEFYEALYLLERAKLRLTCSDGVPMSVFDAYATLLRDETDHELHLVFEHLVEGGCVVAPYKKPPKRKKPAIRGSTEEDKLLMAAHALALPAASSQSAFAKDSDSDLEIISCNMPEPADKDKIPKDIELVYTTGPIYKGESVSFLNIFCAGQLLIVPPIPPELSPACAAAQTSSAGDGSGPVAGNQSTKVLVSGRSLTVLEEWITMAGKEKLDPLDEATGEYRENGAGTRSRQRKRKGEWSSPRKAAASKRGKKAKQQAGLGATPGPEPFAGIGTEVAALPNVFGYPPVSTGVTADASTERFHRRWFPRWFDGLELGVHSSSVQSTLHRFTRDGIPSIPSARSWQEYKEEFARIVTERSSHTDGGDDKRIALYRGTTKPLMTGTKGNMTALIFEELTLGREVTEDLSTLLERFGRLEDDETPEPSDPASRVDAAKRLHDPQQEASAKGQIPTAKASNETTPSFVGIKIEKEKVDDDTSCRAQEPPRTKTTSSITPNGHLNGGLAPSESTLSEVIDQVVRNENSELASTPSREASQCVSTARGDSADGAIDALPSDSQKVPQQKQQGNALQPVQQLEPSNRKAAAPRIVFDVYTDSDYSKTNPSLPDYRVVLLPNGASGVLKFRDLVRLSVEADDTTLLIAHVVDGRVRTRQVMPFSIPRYN